MVSGYKKGTQIYYSFLSKVLANEPPPGSPTGPLWRGRPIYRAFCISFGFPSKGAVPQGPLHGIPTTRALLHSSVKVPIILAYPHIPGSPRVCSIISLSVPVVIIISVFMCLGYLAATVYPLSYGVPVRERYGSTLLPATREQHDQNCTQSH